MQLSTDLHVVLVKTSDPGNIGAAARALKTMGLSSLRLVAPDSFPDPKATARASGADDLLQRAEVYPDLASAIADCPYVFGSGSKLRGIGKIEVDARQCALTASAAVQQGKVALVFGTERTGLTNEELELCQYFVTIPANSAYDSLNLAAAVQVLCYELRMAALAAAAPDPDPERLHVPAPNAQMEHFFAHLHETLGLIGFFGDRASTKIMRRLRRLYQRAMPDERELQILRGILTETQVAARGRAGKAQD